MTIIREGGGWIVLQEAGFTQVVPLDDLWPHVVSSPCPCCPTVNEDLEIMVHSSYDGREAFERKTRLPS